MPTTVVITYDPASVPVGSTLRLYRRSDNAALGPDVIADGSGSSTFLAPNAIKTAIQLMAYDGPEINIDVQPITVSLS